MAEVLPVWPQEHLGLGKLSGYRAKRRPNTVETPMASGPPKVRIITRDVITDHSFTLRFTAAQLGYFEWWHDTVLEYGVRFFQMPLRTGVGINPAECRFVEVGEARAKDQHFEVPVKLMTRYRPSQQLTEAQLLDLLKHGTYKTQSELDTLTDIINREW